MMDACERHAWQGAAIGLLDLDAFFASVEQRDHPEWRGRPVIVAGDVEAHGVVSCASYEARAFGVRSAMSAFEARNRCPEAIFCKGDFKRYHKASAEVMEIVLRETPLVEQVSVDEAFFDITPGRYSDEDPVEICRRMQQSVRDEVGITCSVGLGTSKSVAKVASEQNKPRGLTVVLPGDERTFLGPLPVEALSGIGGRTAEHLRQLQIVTLADLAEADAEELSRHLGVSALRMIERARGLSHSRVAAFDEKVQPKSVSAEHTFARDLTTTDELYAAISQVAERCGRRLRKKGLKGTVVTLKLKFGPTRTRTATCRIAEPTADEHVFAPVARKLLQRLWAQPTPVRLVGVGLSGFDETGVQLSLFPEEEKDDQTRRPRNTSALAEACDRLRERFGTDVLCHGYDLRLTDGSNANSTRGASPQSRSRR